LQTGGLLVEAVNLAAGAGGAAARQAVAEGRAPSVSAFISQALARRDADEEMAETIAEIYAENGQPTEEDRLWARRVLGLEP